MAILETDAGPVVRSPAFGLPLSAALALIPVAFAVVGLIVRYFGYAAMSPDASLAGFPVGVCRWDCEWYVHIAERGYDAFPVPTMINAGNWAFFPLMPVFVGLVHAVVPMIPTMTLATGLSIAISYATALIAWPLFERDLRGYALFSAYLLAGPFSIYFTTFMSEPMFMLTATGVLVALKGRHWLGAGVWSGLLSASRIVGVFMGLALLVQAFLDHRETGKRASGFVPDLLRRPDIVLALVLAPLGAICYMAFLYWRMGDALAFLHVQRAWSRPSGNPLVFLWQALSSLPSGSWVPTAPQQSGAAVVAGLVLTAALAWRRQWAVALFCAICLIAPLSAGMASTLRFSSALAPVVLLACSLLGRNRAVFALSLLGFLVANYFVTENWIGGALSLA